MKATVAKINLRYEVGYAQPLFSQIGTFLEQIEPIYDALRQDLSVPSDAITVENGNTFATAKITVSLFSGKWVFESRLDGYKVQISDLFKTEHYDFAVKCTGKFSGAVIGFIPNATPEFWQIQKSTWLNVDDSSESVTRFLNQFNPYGDSHDPFNIDSTKTETSARFECSNREKFWNVWIAMEKSIDPTATLFYDVLVNHFTGSLLEDMESQSQHLKHLSDAFLKKPNLEFV